LEFPTNAMTLNNSVHDWTIAAPTTLSAFTNQAAALCGPSPHPSRHTKSAAANHTRRAQRPSMQSTDAGSRFACDGTKVAVKGERCSKIVPAFLEFPCIRHLRKCAGNYAPQISPLRPCTVHHFLCARPDRFVDVTAGAKPATIAFILLFLDFFLKRDYQRFYS